MKILSLLPQFLRLKIIRRKIEIQSPPDNFQVNIATTKEELEKAYSLLHDAYVGTKLMAPDPSGLRCNIYSFLPYTTTVVAKIGDTVVGTVSLIKDSPIGLPSDKDFKMENEKLRAAGHRLVEVSSLATDKSVRKKGNAVSLYLMKYLQHYVTHYMGCTTVTCVIHPRARDFYAAFWGFKASPRVIKYKFVNDALGVQTYGDITDPVLSKISSKFPDADNRNPIKFLFKNLPCLIFPERRIQSHLDPVYTPELLNYFISERTQAYKSLEKHELHWIYNAYSLFFDNLDKLPCFAGIKKDELLRKEFRFFAGSAAILKSPSGESYRGYISDISPSGAFLVTDAKLDKETPFTLSFSLGSETFHLPVVLRWHNRRVRNNNHVGYGMQFLQSQLSIARMLRQTHMGSSKTIEVSRNEPKAG